MSRFETVDCGSAIEGPHPEVRFAPGSPWIPLIAKALGNFRIEIPSRGFATTGTRFGKILQPGAATSLEEKFADAAQVQSLTGSCPTLALHVEWDLPNGRADVRGILALEA